jgi:hypothetical protein
MSENKLLWGIRGDEKDKFIYEPTKNCLYGIPKHINELNFIYMGTPDNEEICKSIITIKRDGNNPFLNYNILEQINQHSEIVKNNKYLIFISLQKLNNNDNNNYEFWLGNIKENGADRNGILTWCINIPLDCKFKYDIDPENTILTFIYGCCKVCNLWDERYDKKLYININRNGNKPYTNRYIYNEICNKIDPYYICSHQFIEDFIQSTPREIVILCSS